MIGMLSPLALRAIGVAAVMAAIAGGYYLVRDGGYKACEADQAAINGAAYASALEQLDAARAHGDKLALDLAKTKEKLHATKTEYLAYANAIRGHCPADVGLLNNAAAAGQPLPATPSNPATEAAPIAAAAIAANIAENYGRANACIAQLNALLTWHEMGGK